MQVAHDLSPWTIAIESTLNDSGIAIQVIDQDSQPGKQYNTVFDSLEKHEGLNILVCSEANTEGSKHCLLAADLVIVATKFDADPNLYQIEKTLDLYAQSILNKMIYHNQLHVDGSVVDNLPIEAMYRYPVRHIIAISLSGLTTKNVDFAETPSADALLWDKFTRKKRYRLPGIISAYFPTHHLSTAILIIK